MNSEFSKQIFAAIAQLLPSQSSGESNESLNPWNESVSNIFETLIAEQKKIENEQKKAKKANSWSDSDEEFQHQLESAVKKYRKNKKPTESKSKTETVTQKTENPNVVRNGSVILPEQKSNGKVTTNGNASDDIKELINYFKLPKNGRQDNQKTFAEYEKQGAIPKSKLNCQRKTSGSVTKSKKIGKTKKIVLLNGEKSSEEIIPEFGADVIVKSTEEKFLRPFFYIIPENPSSSFCLPRGSYYVIPKAPSSYSEKNIIFHPDKTDVEISKITPSAPEFNLASKGRSKMNNLNKKAYRKRDSHLNIGPSDVVLSEAANNLETNYRISKIYEKIFQSVEESVQNVEAVDDTDTPVDHTDTDTPADHTDTDTPADHTGTDTSPAESEKLSEIVKALLLEFPNLSAEIAASVAEKYVMNEPGLQEFIRSEHLSRKIQSQFEMLTLALPENSFSELREKCNEFQGNEELLENYIETQKKINKMHQLVIELQYIFPDADTNFLQREVEKLKGDVEAIVVLTEELLESNDYPRISEDQGAAKRTKLWKTYVTDFNVRNYIKNVPKPEDFEDKRTTANEDLVLEFLKSKYPTTLRSSKELLDLYEFHGSNLSRTCDTLSSECEPVRLAQSYFRGEALTEDFLKELCYIEYKKEIKDYLTEMRERKAAETEDARLNDCFLSCPLCSDEELIASEAVTCPEGHVFCEDCIRRYIYSKIGDGIFKFICPSEQCLTTFTLAALENLLPEDILEKVIQKQQAEEISIAEVDGLESCPFCEFAYIPDPQDNVFKCQNSSCLKETCRKCHEKSHIPLRCEEVERPVDIEARKRIEESMTQKLVRTCPNCKKNSVKIDGCNKMACSCGALFCYICRQLIKGYDHFKEGNDNCPLYSKNENLHGTEVLQAGIQVRDEILRENPNVRILYDPSEDPEFT